MPVPKRRHSKSRTRIKRNSHYKRFPVSSLKCKKCGDNKLPHRVCPGCGSK